MPPQTTNLADEFNAFATPFVESGRFANTTEVLHAAMEALRLAETDEERINQALIELAEEGERSGEAEGDIFETIRAKYGLQSSPRG
jgi:putative addiction module CopG family antidote